MDNKLKAILSTLSYADIFDYPLTKEEIFLYLISIQKFSKQDIYPFLSEKNGYFERKKEFYFLKGRGEIIEKRIRRKKESIKKLNIARKIVRKISFVPTVKFIGISGALAMQNCEKEDDIDLFVITEKNSVWATRLLLVLLLRISGIYRSRGDKNVSNKICLNFLIDSGQIDFSKKSDIFTAHEIVQIIPVFSRNSGFRDFVKANSWTKKFLPNTSVKYIREEKDKFYNPLFKFFLLKSEKTARFIQYGYMKKHITKEKVSQNLLAFHPFDYRQYVLKEYRNKLKKLI